MRKIVGIHVMIDRPNDCRSTSAAFRRCLYTSNSHDIVTNPVGIIVYEGSFTPRRKIQRINTQRGVSTYAHCYTNGHIVLIIYSFPTCCFETIRGVTERPGLNWPSSAVYLLLNTKYNSFNIVQIALLEDKLRYG